MNELKIFKHTTFGELGILVVDGKELFPATESAKLLGYANPKDAILRHCRGVVKRDLTDSLGRHQRANYIPEGDLYRLIARSKLPAAEQFERWVFDEVLPSIRMHGMYATPQTLEAMLNDPDTMIATLQALKTERDARKILESENHQQRQVIAKLRPKASYCDVILRTPETVSPSIIAKDYGKTAQWLNKKLHDLGIQFKASGTWLLYAEYADKGYTQSKTDWYVGPGGIEHSHTHTFWTQKGRLFVYELLKAEGIVPLSERENLGLICG